jgi:hypothetical protein
LRHPASERREHVQTKRWQAIIQYQGENAPRATQFEEFDELGEIVEQGPDWNLIAEFEVKLLRRSAD